MKFFWSILTLLVIGLVTTSPANDAGYVYDSTRGYYTYNGYDYSKVNVSYPGFTHCGVYYAPYSFPQYYRVGPTPTQSYTPAKQEYKDVPVPPYAPGWKEAFIKAQEKRDDLHAYLIASNLFGASGPLKYTGSTGFYQSQDGKLHFNPYVQGQLPYSGSATFYGTNGNTQYGYQPTSVASLWNPTSTEALFQMSNQQISGLQRVTGEQMTGFQALVGQEIGGKLKASTNAITADGTVRIIQALQGPGSTYGYTFKFNQGGKIEKIEEPNSPVPQTTKDDLRQKWRAAAIQDCGSCHSGGKAKGNFDIDQYPGATPDQKRAVWKLLTMDTDTADAKMMPRDDKDMTRPGKRISPERLQLWLVN